MCQSAISLISKALNDVDNAEILLKIKGVIALFIQTMDVSQPFRSCEKTELTCQSGLEIFGHGPGQLPSDALRKVCRASETEIQR